MAASGDGIGPLAGLRVLEFAAIGPGPFAAMVLADHGADVLRIARPDAAPPGPSDVLLRNRPTLPLDLKDLAGRDRALTLMASADIVIEGFRPGVMERLGLGPETAKSVNPALIYGRMTGFGQDGPLRDAAGHDISYTALSGALSMIGTAEVPVVPLNLVADFGGGGMLLLVGLLAALYERQTSGVGQVVAAAMTDGAALLTAMFHGFRAAGRWQDGRAGNMLDGGAPYYTVYRCACGGWISVGAIEPQFYAALLDLLGLSDDPLFAEQNDKTRWTDQKARLSAVFATKSRDEWGALAHGRDACVAPVLEVDEAIAHPANAARGTFVEVDGVVQPAPAPRFGRSPAAQPRSGYQASEAEAWGAARQDGVNRVRITSVDGRPRPDRITSIVQSVYLRAR